MELQFDSNIAINDLSKFVDFYNESQKKDLGSREKLKSCMRQVLFPDEAPVQRVLRNLKQFIFHPISYFRKDLELIDLVEKIKDRVTIIERSNECSKDKTEIVKKVDDIIFSVTGLSLSNVESQTSKSLIQRVRAQYNERTSSAIKFIYNNIILDRIERQVESAATTKEFFSEIHNFFQLVKTLKKSTLDENQEKRLQRVVDSFIYKLTLEQDTLSTCVTNFTNIREECSGANHKSVFLLKVGAYLDLQGLIESTFMTYFEKARSPGLTQIEKEELRAFKSGFESGLKDFRALLNISESLHSQDQKKLELFESLLNSPEPQNAKPTQADVGVYEKIKNGFSSLFSYKTVEGVKESVSSVMTLDNMMAYSAPLLTAGYSFVRGDSLPIVLLRLGLPIAVNTISTGVSKITSSYLNVSAEKAATIDAATRTMLNLLMIVGLNRYLAIKDEKGSETDTTAQNGAIKGQTIQVENPPEPIQQAAEPLSTTASAVPYGPHIPMSERIDRLLSIIIGSESTKEEVANARSEFFRLYVECLDGKRTK